MDIEEFTADDASVVHEMVTLVRAVEEADSPWVHPTTVTSAAGMMRHGWDGEIPRNFVARDRGEVVGFADYWTSEWDNLDVAWIGLAVHPGARRRGVGTALVDALIDLARAHGRTKVGADGWDLPAVHAFAAARGFERKSQAINRRQHLADLDLELVGKLFEEAERAAASYELVRVIGPTPDELIEPVAIMTAAINDAPLDDLELEDEVFTPERLRGYERATLGRGNRLYRLVARHCETGVLAGHTIVAVEEERPTIGHQHDTSVVREHRGHRLGLLLKAGMVRWLAETEPQLETVDTWNAESNDHMIAVNEQLGYRILGRGIQFQRRV